MTFEDLKDAVPFETVLIGHSGNEKYFVGINPHTQHIITQNVPTLNLQRWKEYEIKDWKIKDKEPNYETLYECITPTGDFLLLNKKGMCPVFPNRIFSNPVPLETLKRKTGRKFRINLETWELEQ